MMPQVEENVEGKPMGRLEWLGELEYTHPPCVDREPGLTPLYKHWPLDAKGDLKYLTRTREPVRSAAHWVEYTTMAQHDEYPAGTKCKAWRNRWGGLFMLMDDGVLLMMPITAYLAGVEEASATTFHWPTSPYMHELGTFTRVKDLSQPTGEENASATIS